MRFTCPACSKSYRLSREHLGPSGGAKIKCPNCQAVVRVHAGPDGELQAQLSGSGAFSPEAVAPAANAAAAARAAAPAPAPAQPAARKTGDVASSAPIWHVAVGKSAQGPMTIAQIQALVDKGDITVEALGWRKGMANWTKISEIDELRGHVRAALSGPKVDPAGQDHSGNAPTVMQDVVNVDEPAESPSDFYKASTLRPDRAQGQGGGGLPRTTAAQPAARQAPAPAAPAARPAQPQASARAAQAQPAQPNARTSQAQAAQPAARPAPAQPAARGAEPPAKPALQASAPAKAAAPAPVQQSHEAASFFSNNDSLGDIELDLPDPNKHKPTKEEYQNLLQEFSVMFRLDKRSKRQKAGIAIVLTTLLVGVVAFGVILYIQGEKRQSLIRDSKTILAVFSLPYNNSVTINLSREAEEEAEKTGQKVENAPAGTRTTSALADKLRKVIKTERIKVASSGSRPKQVAQANVGAGSTTVRLTKEQQEAMEAARKEALASALGSVGGKSEKVIGVKTATTQVTTAQLRGLCGNKVPSLRGCGEKAGAGGFTAVVTIGMDGGVEKVDALVGGSRDAGVSSCAKGVFGRVNYGSQDSPTTYRCEVN